MSFQKNENRQRHVSVSMGHYDVTMYTSEISRGSSSTNGGETAMRYPESLAHLAWKQVNDLSSFSLRAKHLKAVKHLFNLFFKMEGFYIKMPSSNSFHVKSFNFEEKVEKKPGEYTVPHLDFSRHRLRH